MATARPTWPWPTGEATRVSVLLGNGNGTFQAAVNYAAGNEPDSVAVGDFNGDGKADLAVANRRTAMRVSVLLGNGNGTFQSRGQLCHRQLPRFRHGGRFRWRRQDRTWPPRTFWLTK